MNTKYSNSNNRPMRQELTVDVGTTLIEITAEQGKAKNVILFTAYVNGISLRSNNLHLPGVLDRFLKCIWLMAGREYEFDVAHDKNMRVWIKEHAALEGSPR